ncbi:MAG: polysaccharide biosynthesis/export family protein [Verrucomicrobia bacterium]|nr:polysaccharide biosynthesis/export family protein [Verrucomicrobiota bacterium]
MRSNSTITSQYKQIGSNFGHVLRQTVKYCMGTGLIVTVALTTGCLNQQPSGGRSGAESVKTEAERQKTETLTLREGDVIKIAFPGATNLDAVQTIRRDGKIALLLVGEVHAAGLKPAELQNELIRLYAPQLVSKEISVSVVSSSFPAFISGAVLRPGKIISDHRITVLEAVMEAGGPDFARANLRAVVVIRQGADGKTTNHTVNLKHIMDGVQKEPFYLEPSDIVFVPERFSVF